MCQGQQTRGGKNLQKDGVKKHQGVPNASDPRKTQVRKCPRDGVKMVSEHSKQRVEIFSKGLGQVASEGIQCIRPRVASPVRTFPRVKMVLGLRDNKIRDVNFSKGWGQEA